MAENDYSIGDGPTMRPAPAPGGGRRLVAGDTILGRYTIMRELGEGGMGVVYQCLDNVGGVEVAVKGLPPEVSRNEDEMDDIRANYQIVRKLRHPNIAGATTLEKDAATGDYYLVMDLASGVSLKRWLKRNPQATMETKLAILRQVATALDYAHTEKVIHRDVKPENVMVDDDGHVKVLDFGLAAQIRSSQSRTSNAITSKGGTPGYKSPEQWLGRPQQAPADVYAFGVMAYWLFSGHLPFDGDDPVVLGHAVLTAPVEPIPDLPDCMNAALVKALAKKPEDRFSSCGAFVDGLEGKDFSRVEHVERVDGNAGRAVAPRPPQGGPRPVAALKALFAVAALALVAAGVWWWLSGREKASRVSGTAGTTRTIVTNVPQVASVPPVSEVPSSTTQKSALHQGSGAKTITPPVVTNDTDSAESRHEAEEERKKTATTISIEATVRRGELGRNISDEDGFKKKKDDLEDLFARAGELLKAEKWNEAAQQFTTYTNECNALEKLDGERKSAVEARTKANVAKGKAEEAEAEKYANDRWNPTVKLMESASSQFAARQFGVAVSSFSLATEQFDKCVEEAAAERNRREDAAKKKAEEDVREKERHAKWRKEGEPFTINNPNGFNMTMKWCPKGTFTMGSPLTEDGRDDDERQHEVTLTKGFWMGETEVTQGQWKKMMGGETVIDLARKALQDDTEYMLAGKKQTLRTSFNKTKYDDPQGICGDVSDDLPVYWVNWEDAVLFCRKLTVTDRAEGRIPDGYEYRLPTEAEWEYACRAGTTSALPNGRDIRILGMCNAPALDDIAWYGGNSSSRFDGRGWDTSNLPEKQYSGGRAAPREVKGRQPNNWGLYDMIGNVWEWCGDWYGEYPYESAIDPVGAGHGAYRVIRGGGWNYLARSCRSAFRTGFVPGYRNICLGFRVVLAPSH